MYGIGWTRPLPYVIPRPIFMICQASDCTLIIPVRPSVLSKTTVRQPLRMGCTVLNAVVNHFYIMATKPVNGGETGLVVDGMTLNLPFRICLHKDSHGNHGRPLSGGEAAPCPEPDPLRRGTLKALDEPLDSHLRPPCPLQGLRCCRCVGVKKKSKTHHIVDALGDKLPLTTLGILPVLVRGINDQVALFKVGM